MPVRKCWIDKCNHFLQDTHTHTYNERVKLNHSIYFKNFVDFSFHFGERIKQHTLLKMLNSVTTNSPEWNWVMSKCGKKMTCQANYFRLHWNNLSGRDGTNLKRTLFPILRVNIDISPWLLSHFQPLTSSRNENRRTKKVCQRKRPCRTNVCSLS